MSYGTIFLQISTSSVSVVRTLLRSEHLYFSGSCLLPSRINKSAFLFHLSIQITTLNALRQRQDFQQTWQGAGIAGSILGQECQGLPGAAGQRLAARACPTPQARKDRTGGSQGSPNLRCQHQPGTFQDISQCVGIRIQTQETRGQALSQLWHRGTWRSGGGQTVEAVSWP